MRLGQMTTEARARVESADDICFLVAEPALYVWLRSLRPDADDLHRFYGRALDRSVSYERMIERILGSALEGHSVVGEI